jgi:hypothetical protein
VIRQEGGTSKNEHSPGKNSTRWMIRRTLGAYTSHSNEDVGYACIDYESIYACCSKYYAKLYAPTVRRNSHERYEAFVSPKTPLHHMMYTRQHLTFHQLLLPPPFCMWWLKTPLRAVTRRFSPVYHSIFLVFELDTLATSSVNQTTSV